VSWMKKLADTYPHILEQRDNNPWPLAHVKKTAHVEVSISAKGNFIKAKVLNGDDAITLIPVTEKSGSRTGNVEPHPLCEELSYCALDLVEGVKKKNERNTSFLALLDSWTDSEFSHRKLEAVRTYVKKETLWRDVSCSVDFPLVFKAKSTQKIAPEKCFIRWSVEEDGEVTTGTWEDQSLINKWILFESTLNPKLGFCYVIGEEARLAKYHPKFIRHAADGARFITQNDWDSYTFMGRFTDSKKQVTENNFPSQVSEVSFEVTQKAHNALRWLIANRGKKNGDQVVVTWAVSGQNVPEPIAETKDFFDFDVVEGVSQDWLAVTPNIASDLGENFAKGLNRYMAGYFDGRVAKLKEQESIVVMGLDSATPGRMAITYYRDFLAKDYIQTIEKWYLHMAWPQRFSIENANGSKKVKKQVFWLIGAPSPWNILQAAYGDVVKSNEELKKSLYERLLPCIVEGRPLPIDIVNLAVARASNRNNCELWEWERNVGVACALFRGFHHPERQPDSSKRRNYAMSLDTECTSRDYLFGRLLAVAERIEEMAMWAASEPSRSTHASRLMQRFSDRPASTWLNIRNSLVPYQQRLKVKLPPLGEAYNRLLDDISDAFTNSDFISDRRLSGEYLLGFHCQRKWLREHKIEKGQWVVKKADEIATTVSEGNEA
jgi:CRISPR-associated protein Csd1